MEMNHWRAMRILCLTLAMWSLVGSALAESGDYLHWRADKGRVDARIRSWSFERVLESVARATGWEVFVEPDTGAKVSVAFKDLPKGRALRRLLGDLNYAIVPRSGRADKLVIYATNIRSATKRIEAFDAMVGGGEGAGLKKIGNELVVKLDGKQDMEALARKLGAQIVGSLDDEGLYRLRFEDEEAANKAKETIDSMEDLDAEANYAVPRPPGPQSLPAGAALPFTLNPSPPGGDALIVGMIDTAIQPEAGNLEGFLLPGVSIGGDATLPSGEPTHGTSMADTTLRGVSLSLNGETSGIRILPVDVYGASEFTSTFDVAWGVSEAIKQGAKVVNLSLGGSGDTEYLRTLIGNGVQEGVVFFASAGNEPVTTPVYPAAYEQVIAVTAGDRNGQLAPYANRGGFVDIIAPGGNVVSFGDTSFLISGTSPASAFAAGMAVGMAERNGGSIDAGVKQLRESFEFKGN